MGCINVDFVHRSRPCTFTVFSKTAYDMTVAFLCELWSFPNLLKFQCLVYIYTNYFHLIVVEFFHFSKNLFDDLVKVHYYTNEYLLMPITGKFSHALPAWSSKEFYYEFFINGCDNNLCERLLFPSSIIYWSEINSQLVWISHKIILLENSLAKKDFFLP